MYPGRSATTHKKNIFAFASLLRFSSVLSHRSRDEKKIVSRANKK
jgi:hypothetical protein